MPAEVDNSLFPNTWSKYDINTRISYISTNINEVRVSVTYLITLTLINKRKIAIQWEFRFLFYWNREIKYPWGFLQSPNSKSNTRKM